MNRYHRRRCRSPEWSAYMAGTVLPHALDGVSLGPRVLELGPGYGASTRPLAARTRSLTVLEADPLLAARLRAEMGSVRVVNGDATSMGFGAGSFSSVVCFTMLHHLPGAAAQDRLFAEAARVLRPGGVFAGTDSRPSLRWRLIHLGDTCTPVDPATLPSRLAAAGFTRIGVDADRRLARFVAYTPGPEAETRPGAVG
jgi:SAM-dependent methyltransferase